MKIKEYTTLMIKELAEYSILEAFIKDDEFAKFTVRKASRTSWGEEVMFGEYWRDESCHEMMFEEDTSGFMCYKGSPLAAKIDDVFFLDNKVVIDFTLVGTVKCKLVMNEDKLTLNLTIDGRSVLSNENIKTERLYKNSI